MPIYNETIINAPIAIFLGAGASQSLGKPLMGEFITRLEQQDALKNTYLFRTITAKQRDLEFLLEELEQWANKDYFTLAVPQKDGPPCFRE